MVIENKLSDMKNNDGLRCERKFLVSDLSVDELEDVILHHPAMFTPIFSERYVNNIYFDSLEFMSYRQSIEGLDQRKKIRIRWYGDLSGPIKNPVLETKKKWGTVGKKEIYPLSNFKFEDFFSEAATLDLIKKVSLTENLKKDLYFLEAKLINRYNRKYFLSANGCYRITLDFNIFFYPVRPFPPAFFKNTICEPYSVLELKYNHVHDNEASKITSHLPFRLTKSSKYVSGVYKLYFFSS
jgi:SPX domain protein involved in polyphosphate accumulation